MEADRQDPSESGSHWWKKINPTNLVMTTAGFLLIILGVALPLTRPSNSQDFPWQLLTGALATAVGGVVLSWIASVAVSRRSATEDLGDRIATVTRSVRQATGQITRSIQLHRAGQIEPIMALELIFHQTRRIQSDTNEISLIIGTRITDAGVQENITDIDEVAAFLGDANAPPELRQKLNKVRTQLARKPVAAGLPEANLPINSTYKTITCPECQNGVTIRIHLSLDPQDLIHETQAACLNCYSSLAVSHTDYTPRVIGQFSVTEHAPIIKRNGARPVTRCNTCGRSIGAQIDKDNKFYSMCRADHTMAIVTRAEFNEWKTRQIK